MRDRGARLGDRGIALLVARRYAHPTVARHAVRAKRQSNEMSYRNRDGEALCEGEAQS